MTTDTTTTTGEQTNSPAGGEGGSAAAPNAPQSQQPPAGEGGEGQGGEATAGKAGEGGDNGKPEGGKEGEKPTDKPEDKAGDGAPEAYEAFTLPAGWQLDGERLEKATAFFKAANLPQAKAQEVIDEFLAGSTDAIGAQFSELVDGWGEQLKNDPDFGGAGFEANLTTAGKYLAEVGGAQLVEDLDKYGLGNLPSLNKFVLAAAKREADLTEKLRIATGEGGLPGMGGGANKGVEPTLAQRMYPNQGKT